ncbi:MAG: AGE family epimerase/isomerase [Gemmataceae bacterium]
MARLRIREPGPRSVLEPDLGQAYRDYLEVRIQFLLERYRTHPDFPGVHTGYNALTGVDFATCDLVSYSWINGRGACVFALFADAFPAYREELLRFARKAIETMEQHMDCHQGCLPFMVNLDGSERVIQQPVRAGRRSDSDLHGCQGFLEYGARAKDARRVATARQMYVDIVRAIRNNDFVTQPTPTPATQRPHCFFTINVANVFVKLLGETSFLEDARTMVENSIDSFYIPEWGAVVERINTTGGPFVDDKGHSVVDPGHTIEFLAFALEFARLADAHGMKSAIQDRLDQLAPQLLRWNLEHGWNARREGIYKNIDARSHAPLNSDMPWWSLPEALVALLLAYERTGADEFLERYRQVNNAYFTHFLNPQTHYGPFQTRSGTTGEPIDVVPACKFQDPEFHAGRNLLACVHILNRLRGEVE